jgi:hypothetical protein
MVAQTRKRSAAPARPASTTTKASTDTENGSAPLSEPFQVTRVPGGANGEDLVQEPAGSQRLTVARLSTRQATPGPSSRKLPVDPNDPPRPALATTRKSKTTKLAMLPGVLEGPSEVGAGSRDGVLASEALLARSSKAAAGRKRTATSDAPGSGARGQATIKLASAKDFPDDHWKEPNSDEGLPPSAPPSPSSHPPANSPMKVDKGKARAAPLSSPVEADPLLAKRLAARVPTIHTAPLHPFTTSTPFASSRPATHALLPPFFDAPNATPMNVSRKHVSDKTASRSQRNTPYNSHAYMTSASAQAPHDLALNRSHTHPAPATAPPAHLNINTALPSGLNHNTQRTHSKCSCPAILLATYANDDVSSRVYARSTYLYANCSRLCNCTAPQI